MKEIKLKLPFTKKKFRVQGSEKDKSIIGAIEYNQGYYEVNVMSVLERNINNDDVCMDIGANIGVISLALGYLCNNGKVYSFEPSVNNFEYLNKNVDINKLNNIEVINKGLYDKDCELDFSYIEEVAGCSFASEVGVREGMMEKISCINFDKWCIENSIDKIDFIKMDVEGAEIRAFQGMINSIKRLKPKMIIEFNPGPIERFYNSDPEELFLLLKDNFNTISLIDPEGEMILITDYSQLKILVNKGKGWEDLFCEF